ncbi:hypothetical protein, partial [Pseudomonas syringae group genomosp. 7]|uniref:hypothetical protein n=1 Tax=Pseudomonas syringae group genomosp. 7 TaxID=251699 RepID=UPI00377040D9
MSKTQDKGNPKSQQVNKETQRIVRSTPVEHISKPAPQTNKSDDLNIGIVLYFAYHAIHSVVNSVMRELLHENN